MKKLLIISGPSGVGKGPLLENISIINDIGYKRFRVRKQRTSRHTGKEPNLGFENMTGPYYGFDCRGSVHRYYLDPMEEFFLDNDKILIESYYKALDFLSIDFPSMFKLKYNKELDVRTIFISPISKEDINNIDKDCIEDYLHDLMFPALLNRARKEKSSSKITTELKMELHYRAYDSYNEINIMDKYDHHIVNRCFEGDSGWDPPLSIEAKESIDSLLRFVEY